MTTSADGVQTGHDAHLRNPRQRRRRRHRRPDPVTKNSAVLHGSYRGQGLDTDYFFELGTESAIYGQKFPAAPARRRGRERPPAGRSDRSRPDSRGRTEYHYRARDGKLARDRRTAQDRTFTTPPPITDIETGGVTNVGNESAELNGSFTADPSKSITSSNGARPTAYGNSTPALPGNALPPAAARRRAARPARRPSRKAASTTTGSSPATRPGPPTARTASSRRPNRRRSATSASKTSKPTRPT